MRGPRSSRPQHLPPATAARGLRCALGLSAALGLGGCDVRGFWGDTFLSDAPRACGAGAAAGATCPAGTTCDEAAGRCRPVPDGGAPGCREHGECGPAGLCRLDEGFPGASLAAVGGCIPTDRICVVSGDRCLPGGDGSPERPLCDAGEAPARGGRCAFARVLPRADGQRYGALRMTSGNLVIVGPGRDAPKPATLGGVDVSGSATLSVVDIVVEYPENSALHCGAGGRLAVRHVVAQASALGVEAVDCADLSVVSSRISGNRNDGVHIEAGEWRVVNTLVLGNAFDSGAAASGVYIKGGRGTFSFNTIVGNGRMDQDGGGVSCTAGPDRFVLLTDSIVTGNGVGGMRSQFLGSCRLDRVVVGSDAVASAGAIKMEPQLDPVTFHLTERSRDCCVDRATKDPMVLDDYEGTPRPQGAGFDIGFHELR